MSDDQANQLTHEQRRVQDDLQRMRRYRPDPAYQARLRQRFVSGRIAESRDRLPRTRDIRQAVLSWAVAPVVVVAMLLVVLIGSRGPSWSLLRVSGKGSVLLNGEPIAVGPSTDLKEILESQAHLLVPPEVEIELVCDRIAVMGISPGTEVTIPRTPGRWFGKIMSGEIRRGEILVKTGPDFAGNHLLVLTPEGRIEITGTTVSVFCNEELTCVCVLKGEARIGKDTASLEAIPSGMRKVMFRNGRPPLVTEIAPEHRVGLVQFEERNQGVFGRIAVP